MIKCEICEGTNILRQGDVFVCQNCGIKYSAEELKRMYKQVSSGNEDKPEQRDNIQKTTDDDPEYLKRSSRFVESYFHERVTEDFIVMGLQQGQISPNAIWEGDGVKASLLTLAIERKHQNLIEYLLSNTNCDVNVDVYEFTERYSMNVYSFPLDIAIKQENYSLADRLLELGADINKKEKIGNVELSMLTLYSGMGGESQVDYLLRKGSNPNVKDNNGSFLTTPLIEAMRYYKYSIAKKLLRAGADTEFVVNNVSADYTALNWSVMHGDEEGVRLLLEAKANPNAVRKSHQDCGRYPALYDAVCRGNKAIVEMLLKAGADPNCAYSSMESSKTAYQKALEMNNYTIILLLIANGAKTN